MPFFQAPEPAASSGGGAGGDDVEAGGGVQSRSIQRARALAALSVGTEVARPECGAALLRVGSPSRPSDVAIRPHDVLAKSPAKPSAAQRRSLASREAPLSPHARVL